MDINKLLENELYLEYLISNEQIQKLSEKMQGKRCNEMNIDECLDTCKLYQQFIELRAEKIKQLDEIKIDGVSWWRYTNDIRIEHELNSNGYYKTKCSCGADTYIISNNINLCGNCYVKKYGTFSTNNIPWWLVVPKK